MKRIVVLISGSGTNLQSLMDACACGEIPGEIVHVHSSDKEAFGLERAKKEGIATSFGREKLVSVLEELQPDLIVLAGYIKLLPKEIVDAFDGRIINIHPSLIPSFCGKGYYGMKVHEAVIAYGVKISGCTVHFVCEDYDEGPVIMQRAVAVSPEDTPQSLQKKVLSVEHETLKESVKAFCEDRIAICGRTVYVKEK